MRHKVCAECTANTTHHVQTCSRYHQKSIVLHVRLPAGRHKLVERDHKTRKQKTAKHLNHESAAQTSCIVTRKLIHCLSSAHKVETERLVGSPFATLDVVIKRCCGRAKPSFGRPPYHQYTHSKVDLNITFNNGEGGHPLTL